MSSAPPTAAPRRLPPPTPLHHAARLLAYAVAGVGLLSPTAYATDCSLTESRAALATLSGQRIASLEIVTGGPELPPIARRAAGLHAVTRSETIRRQLLFAPGDTVDTLRVGETLRRLRAQRLYADAVLFARQCDDAQGVALTLRTEDSWTLRPTARLRTPASVAAGIEEKNLFGTGRTIALTSEMSRRGTGGGMSLTDPWLFGRDITGSIRVTSLAGSHTLRLGLRNHEYSLFDRSRVEANLSRFGYADTGAAERALHSMTATLLLGRRLGESRTASTMLLAGLEFDSAAAISSSRRMAADVPPGTPHVRSYAGAAVGLLRRTAQYDTASWIVPGRGFLDVPLGWEGELLLGGGYERDARVPAMKLDGWVGRAWIPARGRILLIDAWSSGYLARRVDANHIARFSASVYQEATRGMWGARLTAERLFDMDPDRRALSLMPLADYTSPVFRGMTLHAGRAVALSLERSVRLAHVGAASIIDGGPFAASSYRWDLDDGSTAPLRASVLGSRFRLLSANGAVNSVRLDVGYPVVASSRIARRGFAILTVGTLFDVSRQRDGRRLN